MSIMAEFILNNIFYFHNLSSCTNCFMLLQTGSEQSDGQRYGCNTTAEIGTSSSAHQLVVALLAALTLTSHCYLYIFFRLSPLCNIRAVLWLNNIEYNFINEYLVQWMFYSKLYYIVYIDGPVIFPQSYLFYHQFTLNNTIDTYILYFRMTFVHF